MTAQELEKLLADVTPGRRVQFHPSFCNEAVGSPMSSWDTSHDTSLILPDGRRYAGYSHHKHAADAALDAIAPTLARRVIAAENLAEALLTAKDYVDDASRGKLRYLGKADISNMACDDFVFIGEALAAWEAAQ